MEEGVDEAATTLQALGISRSSPSPAAAVLFGTLTGVTGHLMLLLLLVAYPLALLRGRWFDHFKVSHWVLSITFLPLLFMHGSLSILGSYSSPWYATIPLLLLVGGWAYERWGMTWEVKMQSVVVDSSGVCRMQLSRPPSFTYTPGDYIFLHIPHLSSWELHPFTITSPPSDRSLVLHIRPLGDYTARIFLELASIGVAEAEAMVPPETRYRAHRHRISSNPCPIPSSSCIDTPCSFCCSTTPSTSPPTSTPPLPRRESSFAVAPQVSERSLFRFKSSHGVIASASSSQDLERKWARSEEDARMGERKEFATNPLVLVPSSSSRTSSSPLHPQSSSSPSSPSSTLPQPPKFPLQAFIRGPFPTGSRLLLSPSYHDGGIVMVAAGVGCTPFVAFLSHLHREVLARRSRSAEETKSIQHATLEATILPSRLTLLWVVPSLSQTAWGLAGLREVLSEQWMGALLDVRVFVTKQPPPLPEYIAFLPKGDAATAPPPPSITRAKRRARSLFLPESEIREGAGSVRDIETLLQSPPSTALSHSHSGREICIPIHHGRPAIDSSLREILPLHIAAASRRQQRSTRHTTPSNSPLEVGVFVCGPRSLAGSVRTACSKATTELDHISLDPVVESFW